MRRLAVAMWVLVAGCTIDETVGPDAKIFCRDDGECPTGMVCRSALGRCIVPTGEETAPTLVGQPTLTPEVARAGSRITVTFDVDKPLGRLPAVTAEVRTSVLTFEPDTAASVDSHHVFTYLVNGTEPEGVARLYVDLVDGAGNTANGLPLGSVVLDFTAPSVLSMAVAYVPGPGNPLPLVQKATVDTTITVTFVADEPLDVSDAGAPTLTASNGVDTLGFGLTGRTPLSATFSARVPSGASSGTYQPTLGWSDPAGNFTASAFLPAPRPPIEVATGTPSLVVDQTQVRFLRSPWGNGVAEALDGGFVVPAGPYFALAPFESLSGAPELPRSSFTFADAGALLGQVRVWGAADGGALMGVMAPASSGDWPRLQLAEVDVATVYASGIDEAGNESPRQKLVNAEWVASPRPGPTGTNPHSVSGARLAQPTRAQLESIGAGTAPHASDGVVFRARADTSWQLRETTLPLPPGREFSAMAWDSARNRVVVFGGYGDTELGDTWEWDGNVWRNRTQVGAGPRTRAYHAMAYDSARGRTVLFGGFVEPDIELGDTWEWDGQNWFEKTPVGPTPPARSDLAMAYDSVRGKVVLFGGYANPAYLDDVWEWDGTRWEQKPKAGAWPRARTMHAMAFDAARGRVVMAGGRDDTVSPEDVWEWDGTNWVDKTPAAPRPFGQTRPRMAFDAARSRVVFYGNGQHTWEWDGTAWLEKTPDAGSPPNSLRHAMTYDGVRQRTVLLGGPGNPPSPDTWEWDGATWVNRTPSGLTPTPRFDHAMAYDPVRQRVLLFGGLALNTEAGDTWEWDGRQWLDRTDAGIGPEPRLSHTLAWDSKRQRVVLFGGDGTTAGMTLNDTWEWDGTAWADTTDGGTAPTTRREHAMAYDEVRECMVMFGGLTSGGPAGPWERFGLDWTLGPDAGPRPSSRTGHAMSYDKKRGQTVLFAGFFGGAGGDQRDTWEWDGGGWVNKTLDGGNPVARYDHALAWDSTRERTVLFGGDFSLQDEWEWDGTSWVDKSASSPRPAGRKAHAMAYDEARGQMVLFGGYNGIDLQDTWVRDSSPGRQPVVQFEARSFNLSPSIISGLRVRAWCGGRFSPYGAGDTGARLHAWSSGYASNAAQGWISLASNDAGVGAAEIDWVAPNASEARRFYFEPGVAVQCRPAGVTGTGANEAEVALDYVEVRVRYSAP